MKVSITFLAILFALLAACSSPAVPVPTVLPATPNVSPAAQASQGASSAPNTTTPRPVATPKPAIQTPDWFRDVVLYEIFPRSFYDSDGDGIGDLQGITAKLDYLQELGAGALWLTPVFASPSYHGYDTTDYYAINPDFGTEQDLIDLVDAAHARNIKVILDFVAGHTSDQHPFFQDALGNPDSEYADWYRWLDDAHTKYEYFGSAPTLPSLNQDNPATREYLLDVAKYWMQTADLDGYRLDYALGVSHDFWKTFRAELKAINPDFLLLGEVWDSGLKIAPYYEDEFDATFDFPVYFDLMGSHERTGSSPLLGKTSPGAFQSALVALSRLYNPGAQSVHFLNNHDTVRVASQLRDRARSKLAAALLLTLPSTPMLYYGEEIGMMGDKRNVDASVREPMDWYASESGAGMTTWNRPTERLNQPDDGISVEEQQGEPDSLLEFYRSLIALRAENPVLRHGEFISLPVPNGSQAVAYLRRDEANTILVLFNFDNEPITLNLPTTVFPPNLSGFTNLLTGDTLPSPSPEQISLVVPPLDVQVLRANQ